MFVSVPRWIIWKSKTNSFNFFSLRKLFGLLLFMNAVLFVFNIYWVFEKSFMEWRRDESLCERQFAVQVSLLRFQKDGGLKSQNMIINM